MVNVFFKARSTNASRVVNSNQEPTVRATARPASGVSPEIETSSVRLAVGRPGPLLVSFRSVRPLLELLPIQESVAR